MIINNFNVKTFRILLIISITTIVSCTDNNQITVLFDEDATPLEILAAKEIRKYIYLTIGELHELKSAFGRIDQLKGQNIIVGQELLNDNADLKKEELIIIPDGENIMISGGSDVAVLFAAYRFVEELGVWCYLHGDLKPDNKIVFKILADTIRESPVFSTRGILPFHDFNDGPDWWNLQDYKAYLTQ